MPRTRKRKVPLTSISRNDSSSSSSSSNPHASRTVIRRFHVLLRKQHQLQHCPTTVSTSQALVEINDEIEQLGGLSAYQRMSAISQGNDRGGGSEKVFIEWLHEMGEATRRKGKERLQLLEVGALKPFNYDSCSSWIRNTPIDLQSRHASILEQDFLLMDEKENYEKWDAISLSLVINFVPNAKDRGRMLCMAWNMLTPIGLLFLVLPLPCVENSRYTTFDTLQRLMMTIGFAEIKVRWKKGGKMAYWLFRKDISSSRSDATSEDFRRKTVHRQGNRNNFVILLP